MHFREEFEGHLYVINKYRQYIIFLRISITLILYTMYYSVQKTFHAQRFAPLEHPQPMLLTRHGSLEIYQVELLRDTQVVHPAIRPESVRPQRSALAQNFPNPFNPSTTIPFIVGALAAPQTGVAKSQPVELEIYNPLGQKLRTLVADLLAVGRHEVEWDGRDDGGIEVASGLYIYRLRIGSFVQTRRLLLVR